MLRKLLPHGTIILCGMYIVFFFIDRVNSAMAFINNNITKRLLVVLCVFAVIESVWLIREERRKIRQQQARADAARRQRQRQEPQRSQRAYASRQDYPARRNSSSAQGYSSRRSTQGRGDYQPRRRLYDEDTSSSYRR